jgi:hypothetical protein
MQVYAHVRHANRVFLVQDKEKYSEDGTFKLSTALQYLNFDLNYDGVLRKLCHFYLEGGNFSFPGVAFRIALALSQD